MSKPKKSKAIEQQVTSLLSKTTITVIGKGRAARYEVAVRATIDCYKAVGDELSIRLVRSEIHAYDSYYSLSKDVMQGLVNEVKGGNLQVASLVALAEQVQKAGNAAKAKSRGKGKTGKGKTDKGTDKGTGNTHMDSILELPSPSAYGDWQELLADYNYLVGWLTSAEKLLKKEKLIK